MPNFNSAAEHSQLIAPSLLLVDEQRGMRGPQHSRSDSHRGDLDWGEDCNWLLSQTLETADGHADWLLGGQNCNCTHKTLGSERQRTRWHSAGEAVLLCSLLGYKREEIHSSMPRGTIPSLRLRKAAKIVAAGTSGKTVLLRYISSGLLWWVH